MKTNKNRAPQGCRITNYILFGSNGFNGIAEATVIDQAGRIAARINRGPQGFQAITPAMNYATKWHATEAEALAALFASGEWAYFGNSCPLFHHKTKITTEVFNKFQIITL